MSYEVSLNGETIRKYFNCYTTWDGETKDFDCLMISKSSEIIEYIKYIKHHVMHENICNTLFVTKKELYDLSQRYNLEINIIWDEEILTFEFPDEETAFYFKLKFC